MAEIRLICPGCGAEYVLPQEAIPPAGREVECSACEHVWRAQRPSTAAAPLDLGSYTLPREGGGPREGQESPVSLPPASRRLSPDVLDILREEADHERRLRESEAAGIPAPVADKADQTPPQDDQPASEDDSLWPATTVILPAGATRAITTNPAPQAPAAEALAPQPATPAERPVMLPLRPAPGQQLRPSAPIQPRVALVPVPAAAPSPPRSGYRLGFGLAVLVAVICLALYLLAPRLQVGPLTEWRQNVDDARLWLGQQVRGLRD